MNGMREQWTGPSLGYSREHMAKTTPRNWPDVSLGLMRGAAVLTFDDDHSKDSERLRILITMTIGQYGKQETKSQ